MENHSALREVGTAFLNFGWISDFEGKAVKQSGSPQSQCFQMKVFNMKAH
jgi:hypothetical protein